MSPKFTDAGIRARNNPITYKCPKCDLFHPGSHEEYMNARRHYFLGRAVEFVISRTEPPEGYDHLGLKIYETLMWSIGEATAPSPPVMQGGRKRAAYQCGPRFARRFVPWLIKLMQSVGIVGRYGQKQSDRKMTRPLESARVTKPLSTPKLVLEPAAPDSTGRYRADTELHRKDVDLWEWEGKPGPRPECPTSGTPYVRWTAPVLDDEPEEEEGIESNEEIREARQEFDEQLAIEAAREAEEEEKAAAKLEKWRNLVVAELEKLGERIDDDLTYGCHICTRDGAMVTINERGSAKTAAAEAARVAEMLKVDRNRREAIMREAAG